MEFGITAFKAHLNVLSSPPDNIYEIDWPAFKTWHKNKMPQFAGRYFVGQPYLWGHGEAAEVYTGEKIAKIVPIQRADKDRQQAKGDRGERYGREDGHAVCEKLITCFKMSELSIPGKYIAVFLEVAEETSLSEEYWTAWSSAVVATLCIMVKDVDIHGATVKMPEVYSFWPCICCKFTKTAAGKYSLDANVKTCLDNAGKKRSSKEAWCRGFWARASDIPEYHVPEPPLDWLKFEAYEQPQGETAKVPVPVLLWRYMDSSDPAVPEMEPFINKITLDAVSPDATNSMMKVEDWKLAIKDSGGRDAVLTPTLFGIDRGRSISERIKTLAKTEMRLRELPSTYLDSGFYANKGVRVDVRGNPKFVGRYYTGEPGVYDARNLTFDEARIVSRAGVECVIFFQGKCPYLQIPDYLTNKINPQQGKLDALAAFRTAAEVLMQPAYTPVYFAIDTDVSVTGNTWDPYVPTVDEIVSYFSDVNIGYQEYLQQKKNANQDPVPYYIGVYASSNVLDALYKQGLATHFWQAWPFNWGDDPGTYPNVRVWPHLNIWQVLLAQLFSVNYWTMPENKRIVEAAGGRNVAVVVGTDGKDYACLQDHTSSAATKPITGSDWATHWFDYRSAGQGITWVDATAYKSFSLVIGTDGNDYACLQDHTSSAATKPITGSDCATHWGGIGPMGLGTAWADATAYKSGKGPVDLNVAWGDTGGWTTRW